MGRAALVGSMSVPQGWTQAAPGAIKTLASVLPANLAAAPEASLASEGGIFSQMGLSSLAGRAMGASATYSGSGGRGELAGRRRRGRPRHGHDHRDSGPRGLTAVKALTAMTTTQISTEPRRARPGKGYRQMFYAAFPPEFNSGRMYSGAGSGSLRAAAAAWNGLAGEIQSTVGAYSSAVDSLVSGPWVGPSSMAMLAAVTPVLELDAGRRRNGRRSRSPGHCGGNRS